MTGPWLITFLVIAWAFVVYVILCHRLGVLMHEVNTYAQLVQLLRQEVEQMKDSDKNPTNSSRARQR
jgi:hypothetical protein